MIEAPLLSLLSAGGDLAGIALVVIMWKFDRRLLSLEIQLSMKKGERHAEA